MRSFLLVLACLTTLAAVFFIASCSDDPTGVTPEQLASFRISLPDSVTTGESFTITVRAVGDQGTSPFTSFNGIVVLTASNGSCAPDSLQLTGGRGSGDIVLSGSVEDQTITATYKNITGSAKVNAGFMTALEGDPDDPANEAIPDIEFFPEGANYSNGHPNLGDMYVSHNTILLSFKLGTTVEDASAIIEGLDAIIVGGVPGDETIAPGVVFLKIPTANHTEMAAVLAALAANPNIEVAVQDVLMGTNAVPKFNGGDPSNWVWEATPDGGNWGHEHMRVPQMWNFNLGVEKLQQTRQVPNPAVLIVDTGFAPGHADLNLEFFRPQYETSHGTHIAGTIGAKFDNEKGIEGISPYVRMMCKSVQVPATGNLFEDLASGGAAIINATHHSLRAYHRVVNMSLGYNWTYYSVNADTNTVAQKICADQARVFVNTLHLANTHFRTPLFVVAAGNDSNAPAFTRQAKYCSPMCFAALEMNVESIIVVEALYKLGAGNIVWWPFSSVGGHVSAPGHDVTSTILGSTYGSLVDGTSSAAAHVSGLAMYLFAMEPYMTGANVRDLIISNATPMGGGGAPSVDAWASAIDIDDHRIFEPALRMMCDIDDGSFDGNHRVDYYTHNMRDDDEDVDNDGGIGDGNIDMGDFRRWRDWYLATRTSDPVELSGAADHPKKDVNYDGKVGTPAEERLYPRGDFNGDGILDKDATSPVPGAIFGTVTDLDVLRNVFDDPDYEEWELYDLVESGDMEIHITQFIPQYGATSATVKLWNGDAVRRSRDILIDDPHAVITAKTLQGGYVITLEISGTNGSDYFNFGHIAWPFEPGDDMWMAPIKKIMIDPKEAFLHLCQDPDARVATARKLSTLGIRPGQYLLIQQVGYYNAGGGWSHVEDMIAVFSRDSRLLAGAQRDRVPGAIGAGENHVTEPTFACNGEPTDIPEDFSCRPYAIVRVPQGAEYIFITAEDGKYGDNWNEGEFGVQITRIWTENL